MQKPSAAWDTVPRGSIWREPREVVRAGLPIALEDAEVAAAAFRRSVMTQYRIIAARSTTPAPISAIGSQSLEGAAKGRDVCAEVATASAVVTASWGAVTPVSGLE